MKPELWARVKEAFAELVDLEPPERAERLAELARAEPQAERLLRSLLTADAEADARLAALDDLVVSPPPAEGDTDPGPPQDPLGLTGRTVGRFRVLDVLGAGGMGVAYRAEDVDLGRQVALKFLLPRYALDEEAQRRFVHEARTASALDHPNVCTVLEVGESPSGFFVAMPAYSGETLRSRLARGGALGAPAAVDVARQALRGLDAAHAAGITHRDLKPGNLMITPDGTVKILDFGVAQRSDSQFTVPGLRAGTVAYMSPEQLNGEPADPRADLWAVGVVLYEMLSGRRPFGSGHDLGTLYAILYDDPPPPSALCAGVPAELDELVLRLLSKRPEERPASATNVLAALDRVLAEAPTGPRASSDGIAASPSAQRTPVRRLAMARRPAVLAAAALALIAPGVFMAVRARGPGDAPVREPEAGSVAVLPFVDTSPGRDQEYLGDGMAEEILNALAQVEGLRVPARRSSFAFKGRSTGIGEIARALGVRTVLEGSVHRAGDRVRVSTRLVDAATERHLWAHTFERSLTDLFAVQGEIAAAVAEALELRLGPGATAPPTADLEAYELYLRGLFHWNRRTGQDLRHAIEFFHRATRLDATFAQPYAGLALAYAVLPANDPSASAAEAFAALEEAAARALALDSTLAEAHAARGYAYHWQWRWRDAEREFERALELDSSHPTTHQWYGEHLAKMGRSGEAEEWLERAIALDPLSLVAQNDLAIVLFLGRRYEEAVAQLERVSRADPSFTIPHLLLHRIHLTVGRAEEAAETGRRWAEASGARNPDEMVLLARATADPALRPAAAAVLTRWEGESPPRWPEIAMYWTFLGERERAVRALEKGLRARAPFMAQLQVAPWVDPLRSDPRVQAILREMAFPEG